MWSVSGYFLFLNRLCWICGVLYRNSSDSVCVCILFSHLLTVSRAQRYQMTLSSVIWLRIMLKWQLRSERGHPEPTSKGKTINIWDLKTFTLFYCFQTAILYVRNVYGGVVSQKLLCTDFLSSFVPFLTIILRYTS